MKAKAGREEARPRAHAVRCGGRHEAGQAVGHAGEAAGRALKKRIREGECGWATGQAKPGRGRKMRAGPILGSGLKMEEDEVFPN